MNLPLPEPSMAPTVPRDQPGVFARGQVWSPQAWATSWLWGLGRCTTTQSLFPPLENGGNVLYLIGLPRTEEFTGLWGLQC